MKGNAKLAGAMAVGSGALFVYAGIRGFSILKAVQNVIKGSGPQSGQSASLLSGVSSPTASGPGVANPTAGKWTTGGLTNLWLMNGGTSARVKNAVCHAMQESGGNASVTSTNPDGGTNVGLWQLDTKGVGAGHSIAELQDPNTNARITVQATNDGRNWQDWSTPGC